MKKLLKNITTKRTIKRGLIGLFILLWIYLLLDGRNIYIDMYNFQQLEKAKPILESIPTDAKKFYTLKDFNDQYKADIKPIDNCYLVNNDSWNQKYIFWFQLKSKVYKLLYSNYFYAYPKYDIKWSTMCDNYNCYDASFAYFMSVILHPCKN